MATNSSSRSSKSIACVASNACVEANIVVQETTDSSAPQDQNISTNEDKSAAPLNIKPMKSEESFSLFSQSNFNNFSSGFGFFDSQTRSKDPPPPPKEIFISDEKMGSKWNAEPIVIANDLTLFKGKVNTYDVFGVSNSDLVAGKYEGGLKLWEGSLDLVKTIRAEVREGKLGLKGKKVLEIGCGHGLPGIYVITEDASTVHFQDFNKEVLEFLTVPNVKANIAKESDNKKANTSEDIHFFSGDWSEVDQLLLPEGYDVILMAETVYALPSLQSLYDLIKKCLCKPSGVVYMAGKKHYFGVGGGTRQFIRVVEDDGIMVAHLVAEFANGSSNVREVWKFLFKQV